MAYRTKAEIQDDIIIKLTKRERIDIKNGHILTFRRYVRHGIRQVEVTIQADDPPAQQVIE